MMHAPVAPMPVPPVALAEAAAEFAAARAAAIDAFARTGKYRDEVQAMYAAAVKWSYVAGVVAASGLFPNDGNRWSAIADSALWDAVKMGGHE